ncbi:MAG: 2'-5' RNA ligase family protein [Chloroflexi bacterium]|nr:2'-5' RNA ligase family protein [Chloroflexota bacterium]
MSEPGRRVLLAVVPGEVGQRLQAWRARDDPVRARLLPPHLTLCYRPPNAAPAAIERQVRHALPEPVLVRLRGFTELPNRDRTLAVRVVESDALDEARRRLFDARYIELGGYREWPWHITWVRYGINRDRGAMLCQANREFPLDEAWLIETVSLLERRETDYQVLADWQLGYPTLGA